MLNPHNIINGGSVIPAVMPVDLGANAGTGPWASLKHFTSFDVLLVLADGAAGNGPILELEQAKDSSGTGAKALGITEIWHKVAADLLLRDDDGSAVDWTKVSTVSRTSPAATFDTDAVGGDTGPIMALIRVHEGTLDADFTHVRFKMAAAGGNRLGAVLYIANCKEYSGKSNPTLLS